MSAPRSLITAIIVTAMMVVTAQASIVAQFRESAPRDLFVFENTGPCAVTDLKVSVDLSGAAGGLYFDTTAAGDGVEVFQPLRMDEGEVELASAPVRDGDTGFTLAIETLEPGDRAVVSVDVDDRMTASALGQIRVTGSEMEGARVHVTFGNHSASAHFGNDNRAIVPTPQCS